MRKWAALVSLRSHLNLLGWSAKRDLVHGRKSELEVGKRLALHPLNNSSQIVGF